MRTHRLTIAITTLAMILLVGTGCTKNPSPQTATADIQVAATIFPVYDLVRTVGGEYVQTELILEPGVSPHVFEPTPSVLKKLAGTSAVFAIGLEFDEWTDTILNTYPEVKKITLDHDLDLLSSSEEDHEEHEDDHHEEEEEHHHGEFDPHYWLSPTNAISMIDAITTELSLLDQAHADEFRDNANQLIASINTQDLVWQQQISRLKNKDIVTFHDAFGYFADHFGLTILATFEEFPGKEPTPQYLAHLTEEITEHNIQTLYLEPQLSKTSIEAFAEDIGVSVGVLDPIGGVEGRETYIDLINYNMQSILQTNK